MVVTITMSRGQSTIFEAAPLSNRKPGINGHENRINVTPLSICIQGLVATKRVVAELEGRSQVDWREWRKSWSRVRA